MHIHIEKLIKAKAFYLDRNSLQAFYIDEMNRVQSTRLHDIKYEIRLFSIYYVLFTFQLGEREEMKPEHGCAINNYSLTNS